MFRTILSDSKKIELSGRMTLWAKRHGLATMAENAGLLNLVDKRLAVASQVAPPMTGKPFLRGERAQVPTPTQVKHRVGYFVSCGLSFQYPEVVEATLRVLARNGCAVTVLENTCCGRPAYSYGDLDAARDIARKNVDRLASAMGLDAILSECGSCSAHLKDYGDLLKGDPAHAQKAATLSKKIRSFSEFLVGIGSNGSLGALTGTVTYHDPCHLSNRFAKVTAQPRKLLKCVPGMTYKESYEFLGKREVALDLRIKNRAEGI